jgi:flagellar biosynthesis protein FliP
MKIFIALNLPAIMLAADKITLQYPDSGLRLAPFIELAIGMTIVALIPAFLLMCSSFVRILVVFGILRTALGTGKIPPNSVLLILALMLTGFIMMPTIQKLDSNSVQPYLNGKMDYKEAAFEGKKVMFDFMFKYTQSEDLALFQNISKQPVPKDINDISFFVAAPAFMIGELRRGFTIGFLLYIPFLIIDLLVASVLMSMGMMMLPPTMVSLPFKLLLFVLVDGWRLLITSLVQGFGH